MAAILERPKVSGEVWHSAVPQMGVVARQGARQYRCVGLGSRESPVVLGPVGPLAAVRSPSARESPGSQVAARVRRFVGRWRLLPPGWQMHPRCPAATQGSQRALHLQDEATNRIREEDSYHHGALSAPAPKCPRQDSNLRTWLRRPLLYPLSYGGAGRAQAISHSPDTAGEVMFGGLTGPDGLDRRSSATVVGC